MILGDNKFKVREIAETVLQCTQYFTRTFSNEKAVCSQSTKSNQCDHFLIYFNRNPMAIDKTWINYYTLVKSETEANVEIYYLLDFNRLCHNFLNMLLTRPTASFGSDYLILAHKKINTLSKLGFWRENIFQYI